jgi:hypothetical protein
MVSRPRGSGHDHRDSRIILVKATRHKIQLCIGAWLIKASFNLPGNGDRNMGSYSELVQRIRCHAGALITGYAVVRAVAVACTISFAVAACSAGSSGTSASTVTSSVPPSSSPASASAPPSSSAAAEPAESATPGKNTPEDAVNGLIKGELADNWTLACSHVVPSTQPTCDQAANQLPVFTGNATVAGDTISGTEALVEVTGSMCSNTTGCASNSIPSTGMPSSQVTFMQAYNQALNNSNNLSPVPCIEENGIWYINASL